MFWKDKSVIIVTFLKEIIILKTEEVLRVKNFLQTELINFFEESFPKSHKFIELAHL